MSPAAGAIARPRLTTERLVLRPFELEDAPVVQEHAADKEVARTTLSIPHPYPDGAAAEWIATHAPNAEQGTACDYAVVRAEDDQLIGSVGLIIDAPHDRAELGYVIYRPYWNQGYATEAAAAVVRYGFRELGLNRIDAHDMVGNEASGRVMQKIGMQPEGVMRQRIRRWGELCDVRWYALLREEFDMLPT
jgi:RimJ/RimL family protein N-acetyltransferase